MEKPFKESLENLDSETLLNLKNELQIRLMIDAGITPDDDTLAQEWIDSNSDRLNQLFNKEVALKYQRDPSETVLEIKEKLYH